MRGFRELDPGEAEQVYSSRRKRKEYLDDMEAQLSASASPAGYNAKPSEERSGWSSSRARNRKEQRAEEYEDIPRTDQRGVSEAAYDRPRADRRIASEAAYDRSRADRRIPREAAYARQRVDWQIDDDEYFDERPTRRSAASDRQTSYANRGNYGEDIRPAEDTVSFRSRGRGQDSYRESWEPAIGPVYRDPYPDEEPEDEYYEEDGYEEDSYEEDDYEDVYADEDGRFSGRGRGRKRHSFLIRRVILVAVILLLVTAGIGGVFLLRRDKDSPRQAKGNETGGQQGANDGELQELSGEEALLWSGESETTPETAEEEEVKTVYLTPSEEKDIFFDGYASQTSDHTEEIVDEDVLSTYAVLINAETGEVIAQKQADAITSPASMTKILTLLVAVEHLTDLDETVVMTQEIGDTIYKKDLSAVGYQVGDEIPVRDLLYGTILPSGADAAMLLSNHVAGSQEAFVAMMNEKVEELGLSETAHFSNTVGIYDPDNHCTMRDMAMILKAAVENDLCREVLHTRIYTTSPTPAHPEGIEISNWFLRRIEDKDTHGEVICAKTGFVDQSGCCAASYQVSNDGGHYLCVTGDTYSSWRCIYDHVRIYDLYTN